MPDYRCTNVAVAVAGRAEYAAPPYHPCTVHPELRRLPYAAPAATDAGAGVYEAVRQALLMLGLDAAHAGTERWNPFGALIKPGEHAVLKPNLVFDRHPLGRQGLLCTITHAAVLRPLIDYVLLAAGGNVRITICDVPLQSACWEALVAGGGYAELLAFYRLQGMSVALLDLRREVVELNGMNIAVRRDVRQRDPQGYCAVDVGEKSALTPVIDRYRKFRITDYPHASVAAHHNRQKNEYLICRTVLDADLFINVPKLKTHRKAGISCAMKNLIGINGDKSWIAHHRAGSVRSGGDEYRDFRWRQYLAWHTWNAIKRYPLTRAAATLLKKGYYRFFTKYRTIEAMKYSGEFPDGMEGSWYGNDTVWRCIADLNYILLFADKQGKVQEKPARSSVCVVDGIISGEKEGPLQNAPKNTGIVLAGFNPLAVDSAAARIMGFDCGAIPSIAQVQGLRHLLYPVPGATQPQMLAGNAVCPNFAFEPPRSWADVLTAGKGINDAAHT
ncbi:MAG: DUF362 domain-containing protein [Candidatus Omnitrophica bacterium]|nr:DUF362 domain-containing protein [Candidatus Omnitrophota bacterium]